MLVLQAKPQIGQIDLGDIRKDAGILEKHFIADRERGTAEKRRKEFGIPVTFPRILRICLRKVRCLSLINPKYFYLALSDQGIE